MVFLPKFDPNQQQRIDALRVQQSKYDYDFTKLPGVPILKQVPPEDESFAKFDWVRSAISLLLRLQANLGLQNFELRGQFGQLVQYLYLSLLFADPKKKDDLKDLWKWFLPVIRWVQQLLNQFRSNSKSGPDPARPLARPAVNWARMKFLVSQVKKSEKHTRPANHTGASQPRDLVKPLPGTSGINLSFTDYQEFLSPYKDIFQIIYLPEIHKYFHQDRSFAAQRVAGLNPLMIERVPTLPANFPLSEAQYQNVMGTEDSLERAGQEGRLYLANYEILSTVQTDDFPSAKKYLCAPLALFAVPAGKGKQRSLVPVGIQCQQKPGPENPIFTPPPPATAQSGQWGWLIAKTIVQIADGNYHEMISHLGRTHLLLELFAIATPRQLAVNHPLFILLKPHLEGTLFINDNAFGGLINETGAVNKVMAGTLPASLNLSVKAFKGFPYSFNDSMLPKIFADRGLDDSDKLPDYPYRDDALLIWEAINQWVSDYLGLYYINDSDVQEDTELQNWLKELVDPDPNRKKTGIGEAGVSSLDRNLIGIGEPGFSPPVFRTKGYLTEVVTLIIFTASAQHAAVNFPQAAYLTYVPNMPLAGYRPAPTQTTLTDKDYFELLPSLAQANEQMMMVYTLGSVYYTCLGHYPPEYFTDKDVQPSLAKFQRRLQEIGSIIDDRNTRRPTYYDYLHPTKIPQSINI